MNDSTFPHKRAGKAMPTPTPYSDIKLPRYSMRVLAVASALALLSAAGMAQAQTAAPSEIAMVKLIRGLIQTGALKKDVGEALLAQAQTEAMAAQQAQRLAAAAPAPAVAANNGLHLEPGDVRVPYISDTVRDQIRDEVKGQVMAQARTEGWAAPNEIPEWTQRIHIDGDMRFRNESHFYNSGNSSLQTDFNTLNAGSGFDVNLNSNPLNKPPLLNTNQNRTNQLRIRARLGLSADISDSTTAGIRLATGNDNNPVSTSQTLGGGDAKKNLWLDQAWLGYRFNENLKVVAGRFGNPFMSTDTLFSNDLNFDGVAAQFNKRLDNKDVSVFGTLGLLPLEYTSDNSPSTSTDKTSSQNKYLLALQVGADWKIDETNRIRGAGAYYDFRNITGRVSDSCALYADPTAGCNTDWSRPAFMQKGNTLMLIRDVAQDPGRPAADGGPAGTPQPEYVGLASKFQLLDLNARWDTKFAGQYGLRVEGEYVRNLAYNMNDMLARSRGGIVNNFGPVKGDGTSDVASGPNAFMLQTTLGKPDMLDKGDWNVLLGYKYIEPDALPDAYNDSTFNLGGTNARGYYIGGSYAIDKKTWINGRWLSSRQIYGQPLSIDVLQVELNARF
jgi:hypothetical protein